MMCAEYKSAATVDKWGNSCAFAGLPLARGGVPVLQPVPAAASL